MPSLTGPVAVAIVAGLAIQAYGLVHCSALFDGPASVRLVLGNELTLLWSSIGGCLASWTAVHMLAKTHPPRRTNSQGVTWLPTGVRPQITLWSLYIMSIASLSIATSVLHYKTGLRSELALHVLSSIIPALSSGAAIPKLAKMLQANKLHRRTLLPQTKPANNADGYSVIDTPKPGSPQILDSQSVLSEKTQLNGKAVDPQGSPLSHCNQDRALSVIPSNVTTLAPPPPPPPPPSVAHHLKSAVLLVCQCSPVATASAVLALIIHALLLCCSFEQYAHETSALAANADPIPASVLFPDGIERPVHLSISCHGDHPVHPPNTSLPPHEATIIIEHVAGYPSSISKAITNALVAHGHRVCVYDRPGYMHSPPGYTPVSAATVVRALASALKSSGEAGPYYVVGHRSGSEYAQLFASANRDSVVGMAFIYPTDTALAGLLAATNQTSSVRNAMAHATMDSRLFSDPALQLSRLNIQRMLAALGNWLTSPPIISDANSASQDMTDWALSSPLLAQAQFYEMLQLSELEQAIQDNTMQTGPVSGQLPTLLFGVSPDPIAQTTYLAAVAPHWKVGISDPFDLQPLSLSRVAHQISVHISQLH